MAAKLWDGILYHARKGTLLSRIQREIRPRRLAQSASTFKDTHSARRLNALQAGMPACSTYLEVGVENGTTFQNVHVPFRWGVDPYPRFNYSKLPSGVCFSAEESDTFFARLSNQRFFDLVFLDGLHEWKQTYRDLHGALLHSPSHAIVLIDDVIPDDEWAALPDHAEALQRKRDAGISDTRWQGDVYKVLLAILQNHPELDFRVIEGKDAQAVVWRRADASPGRYSQPVDDRLLEAVSLSTYDGVFVEGRIPDDFHPADEESAIMAALQGSRSAWAVGQEISDRD